MKSKLLAFVFTALLINSLAFALDNWERVMRQPEGKEVFILLKSGRWLTAKIEKVEDRKLLVENGADRYEAFWKNEIQEIRIKVSPLGKSVAIGAIVATGIVFTTGALAYGFDGEYLFFGLRMAAMIGVPIGGSLGALHWISHHKNELIYRSEEQQVSFSPVQEHSATSSVVCSTAFPDF